MSFLLFLRRNIFTILIVSLIWAWCGFYKIYLNNFELVTKTKLFLTIAVKSDNSSIQEIEEASTNFGQTLMWWFKNPTFLKEIIWETNNNWAKISAYKQERQNMTIEIISSSKITNDNLIKSAHTVLNKKISEYNSMSNVQYMTIDQWKVTNISYLKNIIYPIAWWILWFLIIIVILILYEIFKWAVSSIEQVEDILKIKALDIINSNWHNNDYTLISVAFQKNKPIVILAWVNIDTELLAVLIAQRQSFFWEKLALVDWDLQRRSLQHTLWLSSRLKNLKWYTDIKTEFDQKTSMVYTGSERDLIFLQNTLDENLKFVPAWSWNKFLTQIFTNIAKKMKTLIHTQLPENFEILRLQNADLVLVVKLWKTKISELQRIKEVWNEDIKVIIVK